MENINRIQCAIEHITNKSVFIVERADWEEMVNEDGEPVRFSYIPSPISGIASMASHILTAGSGIFNPDPGIDVIRCDQAIEPKIYKIYHYTVIENFSCSKYYKESLRIAGMKATENLNDYFQSHVFIVGPYKKKDNHWQYEIPERIREAKHKNG